MTIICQAQYAMFIQWCFYVGPASQTVAQHQNNIGTYQYLSRLPSIHKYSQRPEKITCFLLCLTNSRTLLPWEIKHNYSILAFYVRTMQSLCNVLQKQTAHRLRRWVNIDSTLGQRLVFADGLFL